MLNLDFNQIRPLNGSANDGFEEFVCQLARKEEISCAKRFVRNGKPDGGVECCWIISKRITKELCGMYLVRKIS